MSNQNSHISELSIKFITTSYCKLLPVLCIAIGLVIYAAFNLLQYDIFGIPLHSVTTKSNYTLNYISNISAYPLNSTASLYIQDIQNMKTTLKPSEIQDIEQNNNTATCSGNLPEYHLKPLSNAISNTIPFRKGRFGKGSLSTPNENNYDEYISLLIKRSSQFKDTRFYTHLKEYRLQIQIRSVPIRSTQIMLHPINDLFIFYPYLRSVGYHLCRTPQGFGNGLSVYWGARSLAYWMNYNFQINCKLYGKALEKKKLMSAFLPRNIASDANMDEPTDIMNENVSVITFYPEIDPVPAQHGVIHPTSLLFMYYNPYFQKIMNYETMQAMYDFYDHIDDDTKWRSMDNMNETNDIVIHIRCGDVLQLMHRVKDWEYGFLTMNHYKYVMDIALQKAFGINWYDRITNKTRVWILSQLTQKAARKGELSALNDCDFLINYIVDNGISKIFHPATVQIMYNSDANDDFYRMLNAPLLFCSPSTYCFNAGMANINGIVIMPNRGAWIDFKHIDKQKNETGFIVAENSHLIPKNQLIIDTEKNGWHCNKIDNYKFNKRTYNQRTYAEKLAEYLVAH